MPIRVCACPARRRPTRGKRTFRSQPVLDWNRAPTQLRAGCPQACMLLHALELASSPLHPPPGLLRAQLWAPGRPSCLGSPGESTHRAHLYLLRWRVTGPPCPPATPHWPKALLSPKWSLSVWEHHCHLLFPIAGSALMVPVLAPESN